jgi:hypothetical protein
MRSRQFIVFTRIAFQTQRPFPGCIVGQLSRPATIRRHLFAVRPYLKVTIRSRPQILRHDMAHHTIKPTTGLDALRVMLLVSNMISAQRNS